MILMLVLKGVAYLLPLFRRREFTLAWDSCVERDTSSHEPRASGGAVFAPV